MAYLQTLAQCIVPRRHHGRVVAAVVKVDVDQFAFVVVVHLHGVRGLPPVMCALRWREGINGGALRQVKKVGHPLIIIMYASIT